ncbi:Sec1 family protein [Podospora aff. communis PSN243]|uniref:Sec1 family protein n=1 Tax=Podospora aff. communis PSN243 TaxID=3040156 RepID=A0AAV9H1B2_9PEZI|nr:Sec1 family protein [Podospora aff. communis PSN243]
MDGPSVIKEHQNIIVDTVRKITRGDWKILVVDETTKEIIDATVKEDDILNNNIANIEKLEERRETNPQMDAIYFISPQPHVVECLIADFEQQRYRKAHLVWFGDLPRPLEDKIQPYRPQILGLQIVPLDFFPRESHLVTFRDPWSFPILYHPSCNDIVAKHMQVLAKKIAAVCISLGELPKIRFYKPRDPLHEANVLCGHLARFVETELVRHKERWKDFGEGSNRPRGVLLVTDRSMDLMAPLLHEFTYQAMAHDLLEIQELPKVTFHMKINEGTREEEEKDVEIVEDDKVWVENRHRHMKDTIDKLMADFQKFLAQNANFTNQPDDGAPSLNSIKDMIAGLPQYAQMKSAYSLHLTMAQEAMNVFQNHKLSDIASIEQTMATGVDEDFKKPKNVLDQVVRLLDDESVTKEDRLRLIAVYVLYRDGVIQEDIKRLLAHASLPPSELEGLENLALLGAQVIRPLKGFRQPPEPVFPRNTKPTAQDEEYSLSRFEPAVKQMLEHLCAGTLDQTIFPYTPKTAPTDPSEDLVVNTSLRSAAPRWASANRRQVDNRQRIIVFVAGGATYSEARACYDVSERLNRDVFMVSSHMQNPNFYLRQVRDLSADRRRLGLPMDRPKPRAPAHLYERPAPPPTQMQRPMGGQQPPPMGGGMSGGMGGAPRPAPGGSVRPPTKALGAMTLSSGSGSGRPPMQTSLSATSSQVSQMSSQGGDEYSNAAPSESSSGRHKLTKDKDGKKKGFFGRKK